MAIDFGEAAVFRAVGIVVAKVPLAEHAGGVFGREMLTESHFIFTNHGASHDGVPDAGAVGPMSGEKGRAGW